MESLGLTQTRKNDLNNIGPRLGLTYALDKAGRSVIRGGYGLFYDKTAQEVGITALFTAGILSDSFTQTFPAPVRRILVRATERCRRMRSWRPGRR